MADPNQPLAVLHPAVAEAARQVNAQAVALIDLGGPAAPGLAVDRVGITYSTGQTLGDPSSPTQVTATVRGRTLLPSPPFPQVSVRVGLERDPLGRLPDALAGVPADVLPVVLTSWSLSRLTLEERLRFLHRLDEAALHRPIAWVSAEGVGVAPAVPTLGDRRASGHSIIGLAVFEQNRMRAEVLGRCWSRGRVLSWRTD